MARPSILATLTACLAAGLNAKAVELIAWDWNDGATQGWTASDTPANAGNQFQANNSGNGSLQMFGPDITGTDLSLLVSISFDLTIDSFSTVTSPADLSDSSLRLNNSSQIGEFREWDLDLSGLSFGETRTFNLNIADVEGGNLSLAEVEFVDLIFAEPNRNANNSSARIDNMVFTGVPEPASLTLLALGSIGLLRRRRI